jgi:hypothetical protein
MPQKKIHLWGATLKALITFFWVSLSSTKLILQINLFYFIFKKHQTRLYIYWASVPLFPTRKDDGTLVC